MDVPLDKRYHSLYSYPLGLKVVDPPLKVGRHSGGSAWRAVLGKHENLGMGGVESGKRADWRPFGT